MKAFFVIILALFSFGGSAQKNFDLLTFQVPDGWEVAQESPDYIIQKAQVS